MRLPTFYEQNLIPNWGTCLFATTLSDENHVLVITEKACFN